MAGSVQTHENLNVYAQAQNQLWNQWLDSIRQFEATAPFIMGRDSSHALQTLNEQIQAAIDINKAWAREWVESLDRGNGIAMTMITWNHQLMERQTESHKELLDSWWGLFRNFEPFITPSRQSMEALQNAIHRTMAIPFQLTAPIIQEDEKTVSSAKQVSEDVAMRKTA